MRNESSRLCRELGHSFSDGGLLELALRHPSCGAGPDNQRLEFLGDAVLDLVLAESLYQAHPEAPEGKLDRMRAGLVNGRALAALARRLRLEAALEVGEAHREHRPEPSDAMLEDALEAVLGALFLDAGFEKARLVIRDLLKDAIEAAEARFAPGNPKSRLQEWSQRTQAGAVPEYACLEASGPGHARRYRVAVRLAGRELGRGEGGSKKMAELAAAEAALAALDL